MGKTEDARHYLSLGYNCGQAILAVFARDNGLPVETALRLSYNLGGGCAFQGGLCGSLSAAFLIYGLHFGSDQPNDELAEEVVYQLSRQHTSEFLDLFGATTCNDLLGYDIRNPDDFAKIMEDKLFQLKCSRYIMESVRILEHQIQVTEDKMNIRKV